MNRRARESKLIIDGEKGLALSVRNYDLDSNDGVVFNVFEVNNLLRIFLISIDFDVL